MSTQQMNRIQRSPSNTDLFSAENFNRLKQIMYDYHAPTGSMLYSEGDLADKIYFLKRGRVKITKTTDEGKVFVLHMYKEGDMFGQIDVLQETRHQFNAEIVEDSRMGVIQQKDLEILLWQHGELAVEFMKWMGALHRLTETKFRDLMLFGKPGALCSTLIRLANTYGEETETGIRISKKMTHTDLGDIIGATRESVNRMISDLRQKGALTMEGGYIVIQDLAYLKDICHCDNCPAHICRI